MKPLILLILLAFALMSSVFASSDVLKVGVRLPAIALPQASSGKPVRLDEPLGEKLMLHLFASW